MSDRDKKSPVALLGFDHFGIGIGQKNAAEAAKAPPGSADGMTFLGSALGSFAAHALMLKREQENKATITMTPKMAAELDRLVKTGLFGINREEVVETLLLEGIRRYRTQFEEAPPPPPARARGRKARR